MTKQEAKTLELACDNIFSDALGTDCEVSMTLAGYLKISFDGNYVNISHRDLKTPVYIKFIGYCEDLQEAIEKIQNAIENNRERIELLLKSYDIRFNESEG